MDLLLLLSSCYQRTTSLLPTLWKGRETHLAKKDVEALVNILDQSIIFLYYITMPCMCWVDIRCKKKELQRLVHYIQLVEHQTPVLQLFYKLMCNYWTIFSFVKWYTYIMHSVSTVSLHLTVFYPGTMTSQSAEPYPSANLTTVPFSHHSPLHSTTISIPYCSQGWYLDLQKRNWNTETDY